MNWFAKLSLLSKIIVCLVITMAVGQIAALGIFVNDFEKNALNEMFFKAKAIGRMAENARIATGNLVAKQAFKQDELLAEAQTALKGISVGSPQFFDTLRQTTYYNTIPVVSAFNAALKGAEESHFKFKPTRDNPRNPESAAKSDVERELLQKLQQSSVDEVSGIDEKENSFRYMRSVHLTKECLVCHGGINDDPARPNTDVDPIGFKKDGKREGDRHGAFQIIMDLAPMQAQVREVQTKSIIAGIIVLVISGFIIAFIIRRSVIGPVKELAGQMDEGANQVASASSQVSQASQGLASGANDQASSLEETSASLEQMSAMTKKSAEGANLANELAQECRKGAEEGMQAMDKTITAMGEINDSTSKMGKIIKTIEEIAFQTNLLALNAAVEAARAGEAGKGFAVVAEEVRNLAQRSATAAKDTASLIAESVSKAEGGKKIAENAGETLKKVVEEIQKVAIHLGEISSASREQSEGVTQVSNAVASMDQVTQQNAATAEESAAASEELSAQADQLKGMVNTLLGLVSGTNGNGGGSLAPINTGNGQKAFRSAVKMVAPRSVGARKLQPKKLIGSKVVKPTEVIPMDDDFSEF
jgi:methyl-accepting chemotaxis protein